MGKENILNVILIFIFIFFLLNIVSAQGQGFTITSVSTSDVITSNTDPAQVYWIINTQLTGGGQAIIGTVSPEMIKSFMNNKLYTTKPLFIEVSAVDEQVSYEIINEGIIIYKYNLEIFNAPENCFLGICYYSDDAPLCLSGTDWNIPLGKSNFGKVIKRYCVTKEPIGIKGVYDNPVTTFNARIKLSVGTDTIEKTICSGGETGCDGSSVNFDSVGVATWTGNLVTGEKYPNQDNFVAIKRNDANRWQIARKSTYENYFPQVGVADSSLNSFLNLFPNYNDVARGDTEINNAINPVIQAANSLLGEDTSFISTPFTKDDNTGKVTLTLKRSLLSPNVVFRIRADWVGLVIPSGQPKILSVGVDRFASGESGEVNIQVENVGEVGGTFSAMLVNCEPFVQTSTAQTSRKTLNAGEVGTITISVSGGAEAQALSKSCSIKVYDVNDPSQEDFYPLTLRLGEVKSQCTSNSQCANNQICMSFGECRDAFNLVFVPIGFNRESADKYSSDVNYIYNEFVEKSLFSTCSDKQNNGIRLHIIDPSQCSRTCDEIDTNCLDAARRCVIDNGFSGIYTKFAGIVNFEHPFGIGGYTYINGDGSVNFGRSAKTAGSHELGHQIGLYHVNPINVGVNLCGTADGACIGPNAVDCDAERASWDIMSYCARTDHYGPAATLYMKNNYEGLEPWAGGLSKWLSGC